MASPNLTLKLLIDTKKQRVLFAEAGKEFIDFLFSLLVLPVATVIRLLDNRDMVGGFAKLYQSVSDLNDNCIQSNQNKDVILKPKSSLQFFSHSIPLLPTAAVLLASPTPNSATGELYMCNTCNSCLRATNSSFCPYCSRSMNTIDDRYVLKSEVDAKGGGFVKGFVTYMVMDDLAVSDMSAISNIILLNKLNIKDLGVLEEKVVDIGMNEGLKLLKHSFNSKTVLTDVFLRDVVDKYDDLKKV